MSSREYELIPLKLRLWIIEKNADLFLAPFLFFLRKGFAPEGIDYRSERKFSRNIGKKMEETFEP